MHAKAQSKRMKLLPERQFGACVSPTYSCHQCRPLGRRQEVGHRVPRELCDSLARTRLCSGCEERVQAAVDVTAGNESERSVSIFRT